MIQVYLNAGFAYWLNRVLGVEWCVAGPSALIGASNFFELAVATAIVLFGCQSGAALATVVGVLVDGRHPIVVVEDDASAVVAFASTSGYRDRECYAGVAEYSVYVARATRGTGAGRVAMTALIDAAAKAGFRKLVSRIFPALMARMGFREVGVYQRHGKLNGAWRDCVIVDCLIGD